MELRYEFTIPVPVEEAWRALLDIERVAPCLPGATVEDVDGETVTGRMKVKAGPVTMMYRGTAVFSEQDETAHRLVLVAGGKDTRGRGTARAAVTGTMSALDGGTAVTLRTDLTVTGRHAGLGPELIAEAGDRIVARFAGCLADRLAPERAEAWRQTVAVVASGAADVTATAPAERAGTRTGATDAASVPAVMTAGAEPLDPLRTTAPPLTRRLTIPALAAGTAALLAALLRRRKR